MTWFFSTWIYRDGVDHRMTLTGVTVHGERIVKQLTEDLQNPSRWNARTDVVGSRGWRETSYAKRVGRYCNARDVRPTTWYTRRYAVCSCTYTCAHVYVRSRGSLSLIHIHQTLINHRPARPRRAIPLAAHGKLSGDGRKKYERGYADTSIYYEPHPDVEVAVT